MVAGWSTINLLLEQLKEKEKQYFKKVPMSHSHKIFTFLTIFNMAQLTREEYRYHAVDRISISDKI